MYKKELSLLTCAFSFIYIKTLLLMLVVVVMYSWSIGWIDVYKTINNNVNVTQFYLFISDELNWLPTKSEKKEYLLKAFLCNRWKVLICILSLLLLLEFNLFIDSIRVAYRFCWIEKCIQQRAKIKINTEKYRKIVENNKKNILNCIFQHITWSHSVCNVCWTCSQDGDTNEVNTFNDNFKECDPVSFQCILQVILLVSWVRMGLFPGWRFYLSITPRMIEIKLLV